MKCVREIETIRLTKLRRYAAGVDPGTHTGVGVFDRHEQRIVFIGTTDFFGVADFLMTNVRLAELKVFVEVPNTFLYNRYEDTQDKLRDRRMLLTGGVKREAELLAESLRRTGFLVEEVPPIPEKKWNQEKFQLITKCRRQTNPHERDACRIAFVYANKRKIGG